jgi:pimeloyl-ACP methyl ester carboxylesterase
MPFFEAADGTKIYWEERGEGPLVVFAMQFFAYPELYASLLDEVAKEHRLVTYHPRGTGDSTRRGPYDLETDTADLRTLLEELGEPAVVFGMADGCHRAVKIAARRPDLVRAVVTSGTNPVGLEAAQGTESLADSPSVLEALMGMMDTDYRSALYTMVRNANPELDDDSVRERVTRTAEFCPQEAAAPRLRAWIEDRVGQDARTVGSRLWMLEFGGTPWFTRDTLPTTRRMLPDAHIHEVEGGVISRPDIAASVIRDVAADEQLTPAGYGSPDAASQPRGEPV